MGLNLLMILLSGAVLAVLMLLIGSRSRIALRISGVFSVIMAVAGMLIYGYGFSVTEENLVLACIRTLISVIGMFLGNAEFDAVSSAPLFSFGWARVLFWTVHLMAFFSTVSTALSAFAASFLGRIWVRFALWRPIHLFYGISDASVAYGRELMNDRNIVIYIAENLQESDETAIREMGAFCRTDPVALAGDTGFLRTLGIRWGKRTVSLYALGQDSTDNFRYAQHLLDAMKSLGISPERTELIIQAREDSAAAQLQVMEERYGYGFVTVYQEAGLVGRLLTKHCPPYRQITFDSNAMARQDFEALIVGFGQVGQAVLKNLIMNGQFAGSKFHADIVAPDCEQVRGTFACMAGETMNQYSLDFYPLDVRSTEIHDLLRHRGRKLRYIALCTGSDKQNREIAEDLVPYLERSGMDTALVCCSHQGISVYDCQEKAFCFHSLYRPEILSARTMDATAMVINHFYMGAGGQTPLKDWLCCDPFSRMSCRASADYLDAMLCMAGRTADQVLQEGWDLPEVLLENLSITEHLRWCAFHYCMGFSPMSREEYESRASRYLAQVERGEKPLRIGKNMARRTHACLIPWEELDALSAREQIITGKPVDYKAMDTDNVLAVPTLLKIRETL